MLQLQQKELLFNFISTIIKKLVLVLAIFLSRNVASKKTKLALILEPIISITNTFLLFKRRLYIYQLV